MVEVPSIQRHAPQLSIDLNGFLARLGGLANADVCESCRQETDSAAVDTMLLLLEASRLYKALLKERMRSADLEAAIRSALGAESDGESDPLAYLRDEYPGYPDPAGGAYART